MPDHPEPAEPQFGIGAVARMTGLTDHTIRVWERRYSAVIAERAANGRRLYRARDIEKLRLLKLLTDAGIAIGQIANESPAELQARVREIGTLAAPVTEPGRVRVAVLGEMLTALATGGAADDGPLDIVISAHSQAEFLGEAGQCVVDVVVVEVPFLDDDTGWKLRDLAAACGTDNIVCVYGFGRSVDATRLRESGIVLLRAPIAIDDAVPVLQAAAGRALAKASSAGRLRDVESMLDGDGPVEPRLFDRHHLSALANASVAIECECPRHLAELVASISAFENYSANCANRNEDDARLHRYLHRASAHARAKIERALERVAREEGLL